MTIEVRACTIEDWELLRTLRLRALAEEPMAFTSKYAVEAEMEEARWRERTARMAIARHDGRPAGITGVWVHDDASVELISMWVDPDHRHTGVATALIAWVVARALELGRTEILLGYADGNDAARALYERCGFVATGEQHALETHPAGVEHRMRLTLESR